MKGKTQAILKTRFTAFVTLGFAAAISFNRLEVAQADPINYSFSGVGSGSLGSVTFTNSSFVIDVSTDTSQIFLSSIWFTPPQLQAYAGLFSSTISISGIGTATNYSSLYVTLFRDSENKFQSVGVGHDIFPDFSFTGSGLQGYGLDTSTEFLTGPVNCAELSNIPFQTSDGDFVLSSVSSAGGFQSLVEPVPEPAVVPLLAVGAIGFLLRRVGRR
jgi:hypothetical protein